METIGDAYMVASGVPVPNGNLHAMEVSMMSLDLLAKILTFEIQVVFVTFYSSSSRHAAKKATPLHGQMALGGGQLRQRTFDAPP